MRGSRISYPPINGMSVEWGGMMWQLQVTKKANEDEEALEDKEVVPP